MTVIYRRRRIGSFVEDVFHGGDGGVSGSDRPVLERLTPLDLSNLRIEAHGLPMNVAALVVLDGGDLLSASGEVALEAIRARIEHRLRLAPRLRQRLYRPGFGLGPPVWVDDASFDISRHVRTQPVPAGGGEDALLATCVALNDQLLDQAHPLWEVWLLTGPATGTYRCSSDFTTFSPTASPH